ncbi:Hypothetical predicted protein [Olea europaea subsp. europaea]|uniref:Uncharacterized protein n=1 Tax=Olea europaea subsp. europaea TaxID=158383 RepID=A0A8S0V6E0_OLEEU|nr:Hypothetical predicted protein [Olea europaea subsp. europaea]
MQHKSDEFKKLKDFISTVVPASSSTTIAHAANVDPEPRKSDYGDFVDYAGHHPLRDGPDKDMGIDRQEGDDMCITEEHMEPCPNEQDMPLPTGTKNIAHIQPCPDDHPVPVPTRIEEVQDTADIEPCLDNDPMPVPAGTNEVQGIPSFIEN